MTTNDETVPGEAGWLAIQMAEYDRLRPALEEFAEALEYRLQTAADAHAPLAIIKTRVKTPASFAGKALLKRGKYDCPARQMTDLCGGRVIARTRSEVAAMSRYIEQAFDVDADNSLDAAERLGVSQFGYGSIHYVVSFTKDTDRSLPDEVFGFTCSTCEIWHPLRGEIQVRTTAQHAFADFSHDISYKGGFELPSELQRQLGIIAAQLEDIDRSFADIESELQIYAANYGQHLGEQDLADRIEQLKTILSIDEDNKRLRWEVGNLAIVAGQLDEAREVLSPAIDPSEVKSAHPPILRDLGRVLCREHSDDRAGPDYITGRYYLEAAVDLDPTDTYAMCLLGNEWRGEDYDQAGDWYRRAFKADPSDAYALTRYLEYEIGDRGNANLLDVAGPLSARALDRCNAHISVGVNLPWALYQRGELQLLRGHPYEALDSYAQAARKSSDESIIEEALDSLAQFEATAESIRGLAWIVGFLTLVRDTRRLRAAREGEVPQDKPHVVMVVGGTHPEHEATIGSYRSDVVGAFSDFEGTVVSGGTVDGMAGIAADLGEERSGQITTVGYLPAAADAAGGYASLIRVGAKFSIEQPIRAWADLVDEGIDPADVKVLGINGGPIAAAEYRIAVALGAAVGIVQGSGRAADEILGDAEWASADSLFALPDDAETLRGFVGGGAAGFSASETEELARLIHDSYCDERASKPRQKTEGEEPWDNLDVTYKIANRGQAEHIRVKLRRIGCEVVPASDGADLFAFEPEEIELLSEMEHGRWNAERLAAGWTYGPVRDNAKKVHDNIVPWENLPDEIRQYDRETVEKIPGYLMSSGYSIRRIDI